VNLKGFLLVLVPGCAIAANACGNQPSPGLMAALASSALAADMSPETLARRVVERRAFEAVIWGMPVVNYDLMLQEMLGKTAGKVNQVIYWGRPLDSKNQTLTPNPDALYFMVFFDTRNGPIVLDLPPGDQHGSFNGNIVTTWQVPLEDAGLLGLDKGRGGKYLVLPPGYEGTPPAGYIPLPSDTFGGYMLFRANLESHRDADVAQAIAYGKRMKVYPLAQAASPGATVFTDVKDVHFDSTIRYDATFFEHLNRIVQTEPWLERDRAMIDVLKTIGIEKGKPFQPDEARKSLLARPRAKRARGSRTSTTRGCRRSFPPPAAGPHPSRRSSSRRRRTDTPKRTPTRSMAVPSLTAMPTSASSDRASDRCISFPSATRPGSRSTAERRIG
jgi:hypothetical protein